MKDLRRLQHDWFMAESSPLNWLRSNRDQCVLKITGIGFNLTSGNFEVAQVCVIENPSFWQEYGHKMISGWEAIADDSLVPLVSTKKEEPLLNLLKRNDWDGTSYFSFAKALKYLKDSDTNIGQIPEFSIM